jgi:hypothetical protein
MNCERKPAKEIKKANSNPPPAEFGEARIFRGARLKRRKKAGDEDRTRNLNLGKVTLYH